MKTNAITRRFRKVKNNNTAHPFSNDAAMGGQTVITATLYCQMQPKEVGNG